MYAYDFLTDRTQDGKAPRLLTTLDESAHEWLAIVVGRRLTANDGLTDLTDLFIGRGYPAHLRWENRPVPCADIRGGAITGGRPAQPILAR